MTDEYGFHKVLKGRNGGGDPWFTDGRLFVGVLKGTNRFLKNTGDGNFTDATDEIGLNQKVFNTRAIAVLCPASKRSFRRFA